MRRPLIIAKTPVATGMTPFIFAAVLCGLLTACHGLRDADIAGESPGPAQRTVYAWFPRSLRDIDTDGAVNMGAIDWSAITHLSIRSVVIQPDGTLRLGWPLTEDRLLRLVQEARRHGVNASVLIWGTDSTGSSRYLAEHREQALQSLLEFAMRYDLNALDMDDETWREINEITGEPNRELVSEFFRSLSSASAGRAIRPGGYMPLGDVHRRAARNI